MVFEHVYISTTTGHCQKTRNRKRHDPTFDRGKLTVDADLRYWSTRPCENSLEIEIQKIESDADYKVKDKVGRAFTLSTLFYHCRRVGECRIVYVIDESYLGKKEKKHLVHDFIDMFLLFSLYKDFEYKSGLSSPKSNMYVFHRPFRL